MFNLSEKEIMERWSENESIRVSICCITYKQELYIAQAIDSFLMQMTTFPFEIIVGEDCGGDDTLAILAAYQARYPNLIKVIASEKNIGANSNFLKILNIAQGDYIAVCEGDDYWIDEQKIQKQYDALLEHGKCNLCFTAAKKLYPDGSVENVSIHHKSIFTSSEVIRGGGSFIVTATIMFNKRVLNLLPSWFKTAQIGDYYLQIVSSLGNGVIYLPDITSIYRCNAINSWSSSRLNLTASKILGDLQGLITNIDRLKEFEISEADLEFSKAQHEYIAAYELLINGYDDDFLWLINKSWQRKKNIGKLQLFLYFLSEYPNLARLILSLKNKLKN
ncbi:glycosyltransferase [Shewanella putrefaciens]|uniref:glycosyltransferase n=1 Tax=Shewanella putrefaciens TaxID=24 RepID=UPI0028570A89|nr:glycosyltransferase [Shewanella putrefaciens]MDR6963051.1 glycosyltransferase involved in cell wall biosynthesis [Shewanella putrefaciens]